MKAKSILLNLLPLILWLLHAVEAEYDFLHYRYSAYLAMVIVIFLPSLYLFLNYKASKTVSQLILLNSIFTAVQIGGGCIYDLLSVGAVTDGGLMIINAMLIYMAAMTAFLCVLKKRLSGE